MAGQSAVTVSYDALGSILSKTGVGTYTYGAGSAGPHAVSKAAGLKYCYDKNGNNISGDGRTITYTACGLPSQISDGHVTGFAYGPDRSRYRRIDNGTAGTTTTRYVGSVEIIFKPNGDQDRKRYIAGVAVETVHFGNNAIDARRVAGRLQSLQTTRLTGSPDAQRIRTEMSASE